MFVGLGGLTHYGFWRDEYHHIWVFNKISFYLPSATPQPEPEAEEEEKPITTRTGSFIVGERPQNFKCFNDEMSILSELAQTP